MTSTPPPASWPTSSAASPRSPTPAPSGPSRSSTPRARRPPASGSRCSSTRAPSSSWTSYARHRSRNFGQEKNRPYGDGVVTGYGTIDGRQVAVFAQDFTVFGGSLGEVFGEKIVKVMDLAMKIGCPVVGINDSGGARIQEGVVSLGLYGEIFRRNVHASGVIPQISLIMGPCAGGAVYSPASPTSPSWSTRPRTCSSPARTSSRRSPARTSSSRTSAARARTTPSPAWRTTWHRRGRRDRIRQGAAVVPAAATTSTTPRSSDEQARPRGHRPRPRARHDHPGLAQPAVRHEDVIEHGRRRRGVPGGPAAVRAQHHLIGFGRVEGRSVGIVANQPMQFAGTLDIDASEKAARFVRTCDAFNVPVLTFVDVPGFLPGTSRSGTASSAAARS
jgi:propionyl-CoA carboxylase beta chain